MSPNNATLSAPPTFKVIRKLNFTLHVSLSPQCAELLNEVFIRENGLSDTLRVKLNFLITLKVGAAYRVAFFGDIFATLVKMG